MARLSSTGAPAPDPTYIDLTRMLARLQQILITPDASTEAKLRTSSYEREKVGTNLEYARNLLVRLEQDAAAAKTQSKKQELQTQLIPKWDALHRLTERLQELSGLGEREFDDGDSSEGEDLLGEDTPGDDTETDDHASHNDLTPPPTSYEEMPAPSMDLEPKISRDIENLRDDPVIESSTLRSRNPRTELFARNAESTGISTATTEALLTHNRTEQEALTSSLVSMAQKLKASSQAFASSLEDEKEVLNRATEGLDRNELGMGAAQKRMGYLRTMTEGKGWWGRMLMYAWIAGLMVLALVIVFVLPKLRF